ncbi:MAG: DNA adenine methylase [Gammaproteobacteria bacterium]|nr:DNA adenine methylase [Gammaproteobacteria bacterium]
MHYPGGKGKTFHHIVNLIPPHKVYLEPFLGHASVLKAKKRAKVEFGVELDERLLSQLSNLKNSGVRLIHGDGIRFLENYPFEGDEVVYCDPPYYPTTRKRKRVYRHDLSHDDHVRLLKIITRLNAQVIISGYDNEIYRQYLNNWHIYTFPYKAHDGLRTEYLWYNFSNPSKLHDYRYLGSNFQERQTIRRRLERMKRRLSNLTDQERAFLLEWLTILEDRHADQDPL